MTNQLPMAIKPFVHHDCNFQLIELKDFGQHPFVQNFVIEVNTQTFTLDIGLFLGINRELCTKYIGGDENFTHCQYPHDGFHGHYMRYKGITMEQLRDLWAKANNKRAEGFKPILLELIFTKVAPLFKQQHEIQHLIDLKPQPEFDLSPINVNQPLTMSSLEIAAMCNKEHRNVMADIKTMLEQLEIQPAEFSADYKDSRGRTYPCFNLDKEMSLTLVTGYNVTLRHKIIKRWQELENQLAGGVPQISAQPVAPAPAPTHGLPTAKDLALMVIKSEEEKESLLIDYNFLSDTLCQTIRKKSAIGSKREASVMGKLARANDKIRRLEAQDVLDLDGEKLSLMQIANKLNVAPNAIAAVVAHLGILGLSALGEARCVGKNNGKDVRDWFYNPMAVILIQQNLERGKL